jgi:hypothetical protein
MSAVALPCDGLAVDPKTGLRVWSAAGADASRVMLRRTLRAAELRALPPVEAERRGIRSKGQRFQQWGRGYRLSTGETDE